jgi:hypothetical protein
MQNSIVAKLSYVRHAARALDDVLSRYTCKLWHYIRVIAKLNIQACTLMVDVRVGVGLRAVCTLDDLSRCKSVLGPVQTPPEPKAKLLHRFFTIKLVSCGAMCTRCETRRDAAMYA